MSHGTKDNERIVIELPPSVRRILDSLRARIRRNAVLTGVLLLICGLSLVFWATHAVDTAWFAVQRLELPPGLRAVFLAGLLPALLWLTGTRILFPMFRRLRNRELAVLIERRFPQFKDRLISSVEAADGYPADGPLVRSMLSRSSAEADVEAGRISIDDVFDLRTIRKLGLGSAVLVVSILVYSLLVPGTLTRWWNAFVEVERVYHIRTTFLDVSIIAQPGNRRTTFRDLEDTYSYLHPRGADLEMEFVVPDSARPDGGSWVVPDRVRVDVIRGDGSVSRTYVSASSARTFRFVLTRLQEPIRIEVLAGDYRPAKPFDVTPVNLPSIDRMEINCDYPEYTGWNQLRERRLSITGSDLSLPVGTRFEIRAVSSKPLQSARIVSDWFELTGDREGIRVQPREGISIPPITSGPMVSADSLTISAGFELTTSVEGKPDSEITTGHTSLPVPSNSPLRFFLHDSDDVMSVNPETLRITGVDDKPPVIISQLRGIDNAITRLAVIPVTGRIEDDYGLSSAGFQFLVDDESTWRPRPFRQSPAAGTTEFELRRSESENIEVFDVRPLELAEGQTLTLAITASDGNTLTGPGVTRSDPMVFRIVSNEELLTLLYTTEITLRSRYEEMLTQLEEIRSDIQFHEGAARRLADGNSPGVAEDRAGVSTCANRSMNSLRRQINELGSITEGFAGIVEQMENNSISPQQLSDGMKTSILQPLRKILSGQLPVTERRMGEFRVAAASEKPSIAQLQAAEKELTVSIVELRRILESVREMAEMHELVKDLKSIYESTLQITEELREIQKRRLRDRLKLLQPKK
ncbi:MAG: hypothetical protein JNL58_29815 [Planctomyces sp.]|nr:hypothetical protein [Planctomyces sp.]